MLFSQKLKYIQNAFKLFLMVIPGLISRKVMGDVWIVTERADQARDNGYIFFRFLREKYPEQKTYYIIKKGSGDNEKLKPYGNAIIFNSWKHYFYFCRSSIHISAHINGCIPEKNPFARRLKPFLGYKDVFIPHGVSYGISEFCLAKHTRLDLFVCSGMQEYENVIENYGYRQDQVVCTGFPRLDEWHNNRVKKDQILMMPTWRLYIAQDSKAQFNKTNFFKHYYSLINNLDLEAFLEEHNLQLIFYLHHEMRKFVSFFRTNNERITIAYQDDLDIQKLLKESVLLITDYSSISFDFAYMEKPVLYYQFDQEEFHSRQYPKGLFDVEKDGFGPIADDEISLINNIQQSYLNGFKLEDIYKERMYNFYVFRDEHNCERVYQEIIKRWPV